MAEDIDSMSMEELERCIRELPPGYLSIKTIRGKERYYHQWYADGRQHTEYVRAEDLPGLKERLELRKRMQTSVVEFWFSKKDGSIRHAFGTTMPSLAKAHTVGGAKASIKVIPFFDVEIGAWRSCQIQSLIKVC